MRGQLIFLNLEDLLFIEKTMDEINGRGRKMAKIFGLSQNGEGGEGIVRNVCDR